MEKQIHDIKPKAKAAPRRSVTAVPSYTNNDLDLTPKTVKRVPKTESADVPRGLMFALQFLAYAIPLGFLAYVLYINYLPFGYEKTFTIDVGTEGDTSVGEFYLEPSPDLSERKTAPDGTTYRELNGIANVIFKPNVVLKDAEITVSVEGEGVEIIPPVIDFNPDDYEWDYEWDFTQKETAFTPKVSERARAEWKSCTTTEAVASTTSTTTIIAESELYLLSSTSTPTAEICEPTPVPDLIGNAFWFDGGMYFDGKSRLEMLKTADMFEDGPFTAYVEWIPTNSNGNFQQITGHYNWELLQNKDSVEFRVGRMNDINGLAYGVKFPVTSDFFNRKHTAIAIYNPSSAGYIEMIVDGVYVGRSTFKDSIIWKDYNKNSLTFAKSEHGGAEHFNGTIFNTRFVYKKLISHKSKYDSIVLNNRELKILTTSTIGTSTINKYNINVSQR